MSEKLITLAGLEEYNKSMPFKISGLQHNPNIVPMDFSKTEQFGGGNIFLSTPFINYDDYDLKKVNNSIVIGKNNSIFSEDSSSNVIIIGSHVTNSNSNQILLGDHNNESIPDSTVFSVGDGTKSIFQIDKLTTWTGPSTVKTPIICFETITNQFLSISDPGPIQGVKKVWDDQTPLPQGVIGGFVQFKYISESTYVNGILTQSWAIFENYFTGTPASLTLYKKSGSTAGVGDTMILKDLSTIEFGGWAKGTYTILISALRIVM